MKRRVVVLALAAVAAAIVARAVPAPARFCAEEPGKPAEPSKPGTAAPPAAGAAAATPAAAAPPGAPTPAVPALGDRANARMPRVHDPSTIIRSREEYWCFSTGVGVLSWRSKDLLSWTPGPRVFQTVPPWVADFLPAHRGHFWAPDVIHLKERYLLYYSVSSWGKNTSAIALATSPALDPADPKFRWTDEGIVIRSTEASDFNAIDPSVFLDRDGRLWLALGSFWTGIKLVELDPATGKRVSQDSPIHSLATHREIEAPCLASHGGHYYLFVNWGLCCRGVESTYRVLVGRSERITGPYLDRDGRDLREDGGSPFLDRQGRFIGPGHAAILQEGQTARVSYHFYDGSRAGAPALAIRELRWDDKGWPVAGPMVSPEEPQTRERQPQPEKKP